MGHFSDEGYFLWCKCCDANLDANCHPDLDHFDTFIRMCVPIATEPPYITTGDFEHYLASDDMLVHFFNDFLSLPSFLATLSYNQESGLFEVANGAARCLSGRISQALQERKSHLLSKEQALAAQSRPMIDNRYTVHCLEKKQGIQWIKRERLPLFLQSDCYFEYRLAKLLSQWETSPGVQKADGDSFKSSWTWPPCCQMDGEEDSGFNAPADSPENPGVWCAHVLTPPVSHGQQRGFEDDVDPTSCSPIGSLSRSPSPNGVQTEERNSLVMAEQMNVCSTRESTASVQRPACQRPSCEARTRLGDEEEEEELDEEVKMKDNEAGYDPDIFGICCHGAGFHGSRWELDEFKEFLRNTRGEKTLHLWMDIERLRSLQHRERKNRHLVLMRSRYMRSSDPSSLSVELLSHLGLNTTLCWTEEKLRHVQPCLTERLLFYWAPRFCMSQWIQETALLGQWSEEKPITQQAPCPGTCQLGSPPTAKTQSCSSSSSMERMLQALDVDARAGLFFTHFCELSGNMLWENAVHFWMDLQRYHQLFYQDGLDPYTVQTQAQLLYATFLCSSARGALGMGEDLREDVYKRLQPAFEDLYDRVEERVLDILQESWTALVARDTLSYQTVCVVEEVRQLDSEEFRELQSMYQRSNLRLKELQQVQPSASACPDPTPPPEPPRQPDPWAKVLPRYRNYRLGTLLRSRQEMQQFACFLQKHDARVHLSSWLALEQYQRTSQSDKAVKEERSADITNEYLSTKYFFGPNSPASTDQQREILDLGGGPERLGRECLSNTLVGDIQIIISSHIQKTWLPLFLATVEFTKRQKPRDDRRRKKEQRKAEGQLVSSSRDIEVLRQVLLDPVACLPFQRFAAIQGDFLENDVTFWLEVQKYKDLCNSHSDEDTIQKKVSTIISCFISSSMVPALQIDIPPEQAANIQDNRQELGPYIFREAQEAVLSALQKLWPQYQALRTTVPEERLLPFLEEERQKHRASLQRRRRRRAEEEEEEEEAGDEEVWLTDRLTQALCFPTQQVLWSYSKHMAALKGEEPPLRGRSQMATSTDSSSSSRHSSQRSAVSRRRARVPQSRRPPAEVETAGDAPTSGQKTAS